MPLVGSWSLIELGQVAVLAFLAIVFLQSGIDKVTDWSGNLEWLTGHFGSSPFKGMVPLLLGTLTFFECLSGGAAAVGAVMLMLMGTALMAHYALVLGLATFLMLFLGQRIAKDYPGAAVIAGYFAVGLLGVALFSMPS